ncbi:MAG: hypothetical protein M1819_000207 [Sarea resinae]|nr:MAG: hypothetical protein M1819_000207 [Sarea resinae]
MGRKPNQLILEFFERGQKLEDASNRYQHTCKACGEKFPKGRIDSLTTHLVKKCPAIALRDRQRALLQLHELPDLGDAPEGLKEGRRDGLEKGKTVDLPYAPNRNWTALETLAEVSRQIDLSEKRDSPGRESSAGDKMTGNGSDQVPSEEEERWSQDNSLPIDPALQPTKPYPSCPPNSTALPPIQYFRGMSNSPSASPHLPSLSLPNATSSTLARAPSALSLNEASIEDSQASLSSAALTMEPDVGIAPTVGLSDKFFHPQGPRPSTTWPIMQQSTEMFFDGSREPPATLEAITTRAATFPRPIAMNPNTPQRDYTTEFTAGTRPPRPKVRGRFTASRRKEVQEVRKRGACIRCRMLKKPCSGESPCSTCINVESARLWKQPCIRTRIADELELYSAGLHGIIAFHEVNSAKSRFNFLPFLGRVEATHYLDSSLFVTFSALAGREYEGVKSEETPEPQNLLLDWETDDLPGKLEQYLKKMAPTFYERECSTFMKPTLHLASELSIQRSDALLPRVLELWTATHVLADVELHWNTFSNPNLPPSTSPTNFPSSLPASTTTTNNSSYPIDNSTSPKSYSLLCSQLRSGAEKRAAQLSKIVMNDLERRLLQRQQSGWFETFLSALILLNCVERTSWLFRTWEDEAFRAKWPLDRRPPYYFSQGEHFADILHMLLKMRGLPPRTYARPEDGMLLTVEGSDEVAKAYFESIGVSSQQLEQRQNAVFDPLDSRSLDLKFCSKLLLPSS